MNEAARGDMAWTVGFLTFVGCWIYAIARFGFFLGVGLGWLPAIAFGFLASLVARAALGH